MDQYEDNDELTIAVVGMSCRVPNANNYHQFWRNLTDAYDAAIPLSDSELSDSGVSNELISNPSYVKSRPYLSDSESFDHQFFNISFRDAVLIDPQQRVLMEAVWEALEDSGYNPFTTNEVVGLFGSCSFNTHFMNLTSELSDNPAKNFQVMLANDKDYLATRIAYKLNLRGPAITVQTACSSSLVAVHLACQSLLNGECTMSIAAGSSILCPTKQGYLYQNDMILSPDGKCYPFDERASGTTIGDGVGVVVLKPLANAIEDHDVIHALISGSAINNDGIEKAAFTAPNPKSQAAVINQALAISNINPADISYIEAHGTGTKLGDPIEMNALTKVFAKHVKEQKRIAIGSVKSNIGHLNAASGIIGLIKTILCIKHRTLVPSINFSKPNSAIQFERTPFYINTELKDWNASDVLHAGVSSFGFGGTNSHLIVSEYKRHNEQMQVNYNADKKFLFLFTAKNIQSLRRLVESYVRFLGNDVEPDLEAISFTLLSGRQWHEYRAAFVSATVSDLIEQLEKWLNNNASRNPFPMMTNAQLEPYVVFMFAGQGTLRNFDFQILFDRFPLLKDTFDKFGDIFFKNYNISLQEVLFELELEKYNQHEYSQPLIFIIQCMVSMLLVELGIMPSAVIGHSIGEYAAAVQSGVLTAEQGLEIVIKRSKLMMNESSDSGMLAVFESEQLVLELISDSKVELCIAVVNSPKQVVVAGNVNDLNEFSELLLQRKIHSKLLKVSNAFHSDVLTEVAQDFGRYLENYEFLEPVIDFVSTISSDFVSSASEIGKDYWSRQITSKVDFNQALDRVRKQNALYIDIGPSNTLSGFVKSILGAKNQHLISLFDRQSNVFQSFLEGVAHLLELGYSFEKINLSPFFNKKPYKASMPTYPFEKINCELKNNDNESSLRKALLEKDQSAILSELSKLNSINPDALKKLSLTIESVFEKNECQSLLSHVYKYEWEPFHIDELDFEKRMVILPLDDIDDESPFKNNQLLTDMKITLLEGINETRENDDRSEEVLLNVSNLIRDSKSNLSIIVYFDAISDNEHRNIKSQFADKINFIMKLIDILSENDLVDSQVFFLSKSYDETDNLSAATCSYSLPYAISKAFSCEYQAHFGGMISFQSSDKSPFDLKMLDRVIMYLSENPEIIVKFSQNKFYRQRIIPSTLKEVESDNRLFKGKCCLITGAMGGIGRHLIKYLVNNGVSRILMLGRSRLTDDDQEYLHSLEFDSKFDYKYFSCDVGNYDEVKSSLSSVIDNVKVDYVFHLAGQPAAGILKHQSLNSIVDAISTKYFGAWNLHQLFSQDTSVKHVLFSSAVTLTGSIAQGAYIISNALMESFAQYQVSKGYSTYALSWGIWDDTGMAQNLSDSEKSFIQMAGYRSIEPEEGLALLSQILSNKPDHYFIADILWNKMQQTLRNSPHISSLISSLAPKSGNNNEVECAANLSLSQFKLSDLEENDREAFIVSYLKKKISLLLGVEEQEIDEDQSFISMGIDSFMAIQLNSEIETLVDCSIGISSLFNYPTISKLSDYLVKLSFSSKLANKSHGLENKRDRSDEVSVVKFIDQEFENWD